MNFKRGLDPKEAMGIGWQGILKTMPDVLLFTEEDLYQNINITEISNYTETNLYYDIENVKLSNIRKQSKYLYEAWVIIIIVKDKFKILKNRFHTTHNRIYKIEELPEIIFKIKEVYDNYNRKNS